MVTILIGKVVCFAAEDPALHFFQPHPDAFALIIFVPRELLHAMYHERHIQILEENSKFTKASLNYLTFSLNFKVG